MTINLLKTMMPLILVILVGALDFANAEKLIWAPPGLAPVIANAISNNKEIESMASTLESLKEKIPAAGSLPDPNLGLAVLNLPTNSFKFDEQAMTQKQISITQKFPWFGKLDLATRKAEIAALKFEASLNAKKINLSRKIVTLYYELAIVKKSQETNTRLTDMVQRISRVAETKYSTGRGLQQDIFQAEVELSKLLDEKISLDKMARVTRLKLGELSGRDLALKTAPPSSMEEPAFILKPEELKKAAAKWNPMLTIKQLERDEAKIDIDMAKKDYFPDVGVKLAYGQRDKDMSGNRLDDFFSASVDIPVPLWQHRKQDKNRTAAEKRLQAMQSAYENLENIIPLKIDSLVTEIDDLRKNYRLYKDSLIVQAEQWSKSAMSGYEVGNFFLNRLSR